MEIFFIAKVLQAWFLPPGVFIIILLLIFAHLYFAKQKGKAAIIILALAVYLLALPMTAQFLIKPLESMYTPKFSFTKVDAIVVLGGGAIADTPAFGGSGNLSGSSANRLLTAALLQKKTKLPLLVSGGQVYENSAKEAEMAKMLLTQLGVPEASILTETLARNTSENARYTAALCAKYNFSKIYLITSAYHMPRSMLEFSKALKPHAIKVAPFPCDYLAGEQFDINLFSFLPQINSLYTSSVALKEYIGIGVALLPI